jgi:hypothetical protein
VASSEMGRHPKPVTQPVINPPFEGAANWCNLQPQAAKQCWRSFSVARLPS